MTRRPSAGNIGDGFGWRYHPIAHEWRHHDGEDIGWANGTTLVAPIRSQLTSYASSGGFGRLVVLRSGGTLIRLAHTARLWPGVQVGQWLDEGQPVAVMGDTGLAAGVHVHWEVEVDGRLVDPAQWVAAPAGGDAKPLPTPPPKPTRRRGMATLYYTTENKKTTFALAGDSPGTPANWLETTGQKLANQWAAAHGNAVELSPSQFRAWKADYLEPVKVDPLK